MSTTPALSALAAQLLEELRPYCERCEIAGSIRRGKQNPGDIELVCIPKIDRIIGTRRDGLFGEPRLVELSRVNLLDDYCRSELLAGQLAHRPDKNGRGAFGERFKRLLIDGAALDLFSVLPPASWGVIMLIRTGPAEFSRAMVTQRSKGGYLPDDCVVREGAIWRSATRLEIAEEADFFELIGRPYVEPEQRDGLVSCHWSCGIGPHGAPPPVGTAPRSGCAEKLPPERGVEEGEAHV